MEWVENGRGGHFLHIFEEVFTWLYILFIYLVGFYAFWSLSWLTGEIHFDRTLNFKQKIELTDFIMLHFIKELNFEVAHHWQYMYFLHAL